MYESITGVQVPITWNKVQYCVFSMNLTLELGDKKRVSVASNTQMKRSGKQINNWNSEKDMKQSDSLERTVITSSDKIDIDLTVNKFRNIMILFRFDENAKPQRINLKLRNKRRNKVLQWEKSELEREIKIKEEEERRVIYYDKENEGSVLVEDDYSNWLDIRVFVPSFHRTRMWSKEWYHPLWS